MLTFCNGTGTICHNRNLLINLCETFIWILITEKMAFQFIPNKSLWTVSAKKEKTCEKKKKQLFDFLLRKGYSYDIIKEAFRQMEERR